MGRAALLLAAAAALCAAALAAPAAPPARPRLVLLVAVDQLRPDRLDATLPGGLGRLAREGRVYTHAALDHAGTETCPGHATMLTGRQPGRLGIPGNSLVDLEGGIAVYCVSDAALDARVIGAPKSATGLSPRKIRGTTLGDWMKAADPRTRVYAVSGKDRAAIALGGQHPDGAFWMQESGAVGFTTSHYYAQELPAWVQRFNGSDPPQDGWMSALPDQWVHLKVYPGVRPDDYAGEETQLSRKSPHPLRAPDAHTFAANVAVSPFLDDATLDFAEQLVREENLGGGSTTDLLAISLSATDLVGHYYGPFSQESRDALVRLDRRLGAFLAFLEERLGRGQVLLALTADHGVLPLPEWLVEQGRDTCPVPGGRIAIRDLGERLYWSLWREFSPTFSLPRMWLVFAGSQIAVNRRMAADYGVAPEAVAERAAQILEEEPGIAHVWSAAEIASGSGELARLYRNSWDPERGGDLVVQPAEGCLVSTHDLGTSHGTPYLYDRAVPLLFWGAGVAPAQADGPAATIDIAPTLARRLGVPTPSDLDGHALFQ